MAILISEFLAKFQGVKKVGSHWMATCPTHNDKKQSLSIKPGTKGQPIILFCHAKCETTNILEAIGLTIQDIMPETANGHQPNGKPKPQIIAEYNYCDEQGKLLYQAVRYEPKDFRQRRPDGAGGWIWSLGETRRVLYRLPELIAADPDKWVFIVEGEKDADMLRGWGLIATSNVGGAGKWRKEYNKYLKGRKVCIVPDNDPAPSIDEATGKVKEGFQGQKHAIQVYDAIRDVAGVVRILALPGLPVKGDVTDWKQAGSTKEELLALADSVGKIPALEFTKRVTAYAKIIALNKGEDPAVAFTARLIQDKINIDYGMIKKLSILSELSWEAILAANHPPRYFKQGGMLVKVNVEDDGAHIQELSLERMRCELDLIADWREKGEDGKPPKDVVANVLVWPKQPLPELHGLVEVPVFGPSGTLQTEPGYHPDSKTYYYPPRFLECLEVPKEPDGLDVIDAVSLIEEMIYDFPFEGDSDKAHAIALFLLPFCRELIDGPTPLHLFDASKERTGKSKLMKNLLYPALGHNISRMTESGRNQEEWKKEITTKLLELRAAVTIDNLNEKLNSGHLASAITEPVWGGRIMGLSKSANIAVRCVWAATGNNVQATGEMAGRVVWCRLVTPLENPELRTGFKHPNLEEWVIAQREKLIQAAHILIQYWIAQGRPEYTGKRLGSFEQWSKVMGGILQAAGVPGFLDNFQVASEHLSTDKNTWREFCRRWYVAHPPQRTLTGESRDMTEPATTNDLLTLAEGIEDFYLGGDNLAGKAKSLGRQLQKKKDTVYRLLDEKNEVYAVCQIAEGKIVRGNRQWFLKLLPVTEESGQLS